MTKAKSTSQGQNHVEPTMGAKPLATAGMTPSVTQTKISACALLEGFGSWAEDGLVLG